jgi:hypothetical protein
MRFARCPGHLCSRSSGGHVGLHGLTPSPQCAADEHRTEQPTLVLMDTVGQAQLSELIHQRRPPSINGLSMGTHAAHSHGIELLIAVYQLVRLIAPEEGAPLGDDHNEHTTQPITWERKFVIPYTMVHTCVNKNV